MKPAHTSSAMRHLIARAKELHARIRQGERTTLAQAVELGGILCSLRDYFSRGDWLLQLDRLGIDRRRASEYMRLSQCDVSCCESIREALEYIGPDRDDDDSDAATDTGATSSTADRQLMPHDAAAQPPTPPPPPQVRQERATQHTSQGTSDDDDDDAGADPAVRDAAGRLVPRHLLRVFIDGTHAISELTQTIASLDTAVVQLADLLGGPETIRLTTVRQHLADAAKTLDVNRPAYVCAHCAGTVGSDCTICRGRGWLPRHLFELAARRTPDR